MSTNNCNNPPQQQPTDSTTTTAAGNSHSEQSNNVNSNSCVTAPPPLPASEPAKPKKKRANPVYITPVRRERKRSCSDSDNEDGLTGDDCAWGPGGKRKASSVAEPGDDGQSGARSRSSGSGSEFL